MSKSYALIKQINDHWPNELKSELITRFFRNEGRPVNDMRDRIGNTVKHLQKIEDHDEYTSKWKLVYKHDGLHNTEFSTVFLSNDTLVATENQIDHLPTDFLLIDKQLEKTDEKELASLNYHPPTKTQTNGTIHDWFDSSSVVAAFANEKSFNGWYLKDKDGTFHWSPNCFTLSPEELAQIQIGDVVLYQKANFYNIGIVEGWNPCETVEQYFTDMQTEVGMCIVGSYNKRRLMDYEIPVSQVYARLSRPRNIPIVLDGDPICPDTAIIWKGKIWTVVYSNDDGCGLSSTAEEPACCKIIHVSKGDMWGAVQAPRTSLQMPVSVGDWTIVGPDPVRVVGYRLEYGWDTTGHMVPKHIYSLRNQVGFTMESESMHTPLMALHYNNASVIMPNEYAIINKQQCKVQRWLWTGVVVNQTYIELSWNKGVERNVKLQ
jgi:hypothetical protein